MLRRTVNALAVAFVLLAPAPVLALDANAINSAELPKKPGKAASGPDPLLIKAEILLDRARFSPGEIDGRMGENFQKALAAFKVSQGLPADSKLDADTWSKLTATSSNPVIKQYTTTTDDEKGPFIKQRPAKMEEMKNLPSLGYTDRT